MNYQILGKLRVRTSDGIAELQTGAVITLSEDMAKKLIEKGKVKPLQSSIPSYEELKILYMDAFNRVGWKEGLMARPEVIQAEVRLNQTWLEAMEGQAGLDDFKRTLSEWERIIAGAMTKEVFNG